ncbi:MAG: hypothetical protein ACREQI_12380 [Candidatus Binataceae bacterium]
MAARPASVRPKVGQFRPIRIFTIVFSIAIALLILAGHHHVAEMAAFQDPVATANQGMAAVQTQLQAGVRDVQANGAAVASQLTAPIASVAAGSGFESFADRESQQISALVYQAGVQLGVMAVSFITLVWAFAIWASSFLLDNVFGASLEFDGQTYDAAVRILAAVMLGAAGFLLSGPLYTWWKLRHLASVNYRARSMR